VVLDLSVLYLPYLDRAKAAVYMAGPYTMKSRHTACILLYSIMLDNELYRITAGTRLYTVKIAETQKRSANGNNNEGFSIHIQSSGTRSAIGMSPLVFMSARKTYIPACTYGMYVGMYRYVMHKW